MSNARQETIDHIVKEMRGNAKHNHALVEVSKYLTEIADRIEAAYKRLAIPTPEQWTEIARQGAEIADLKRENDAMKREREAGAEAAQICGEIGEMIGRYATSEKSSQVGNAAAIREALVMVKRLFDGLLMWQQDIRKAHEAVDAALAAPPRNCDLFNGDHKMLHTAWFDWTDSPQGHDADGTVRLTFDRWLLEIAGVRHA